MGLFDSFKCDVDVIVVTRRIATLKGYPVFLETQPQFQMRSDKDLFHPDNSIQCQQTGNHLIRFKSISVPLPRLWRIEKSQRRKLF